MLVDEIRKMTEEKIAYHEWQEEISRLTVVKIELCVQGIKKVASMGKCEYKITESNNYTKKIVTYFKEQGFDVISNECPEVLDYDTITISW